MPIPDFPPPLTRDELRGMKAAKEEKLRQEKEEARKYSVYRSVMKIYGDAHRAAESGIMRYEVTLNTMNTDSFDPDIISELRTLFPGCSVELIVKNKNGGICIVTNMDLTLITPQFIVIDWS